MKPTEKPAVKAPKEQGNKKDNGNNPKLPGNDPDQTPEKEIQDPPASNPNQKEPNKTPKHKIGFPYPGSDAE